MRDEGGRGPRQADPSELEGGALADWYRRSPTRLGDQEKAATRLSIYADETRRGLSKAVARFEFGAGDAELIEIGNAPNRGLIRAWEAVHGPWPRDPETGRPYDVGHIKALADGGENKLENIRPIHPEAHRAEHKARGDFSRWAKRAGIAKAFGGRVTRGLGVVAIAPMITGALSGAIRTDSFDNFSSDILGVPSREDRRRFNELHQRAINPRWRPGDPEVI